ncbi:MAG: SCP2 sterol-binding domain-containing protein, partial [Planctomycetes bacterium]|nr:SCP2 sterol-binding domain-containing protein [Planctomycetota bacterium]
TPSDVWLKISRGEMNGQLAFMTRKYKVKGKMGLLMKFNKMFKAG